MKMCRWYENGYCENPQARCYGEVCDIDPNLCMEEGVEE